MHAGKNFTLKEALYWTRWNIYVYTILAFLPTVLYEVAGFKFLSLPWLPIALVGTAVAFLIGFKNNATYDRMWEARIIWGAIVNMSRTWGIQVNDFITNKFAIHPVEEEELKVIKKRLIYRHLAWITTLRYQLRQPRVWETMHKIYNKEYKQFFEVPEEKVSFDKAVSPFISEEELAIIKQRKNGATHLIAMQSAELKKLALAGLIDDFRHMEMAETLGDFYDNQGKCERIKNFPYPRQFATLNLYFVWLFIGLLPFGMLQEFEKMGPNMTWLTIPFSVLVAWVFHTMDKIGESTENPFQGGANDIPMAAICQAIECDLREMLDETELPEPVKEMNNILM